MKTNSLRRTILLTLSAFFTATLLTACGGGGGSSSGGGGAVAGSATLSGNVNSGFANNVPASSSARILDAVVGLMFADAYAAGAGGVTVELLKDGTIVDTQVTTGTGDFQFVGLAPGDYVVQLSQAGQNVGASPVIQLDANTRTRLNLDINGGILALEVEAENGKISGEVEDNLKDEDGPEGSADKEPKDSFDKKPEDESEDKPDDNSEDDSKDESIDDSNDDSNDDGKGSDKPDDE